MLPFVCLLLSASASTACSARLRTFRKLGWIKAVQRQPLPHRSCSWPMPPLTCVASAEGLLSWIEQQLLLLPWGCPAWMAAAQHFPTEPYSISCVTSSNPNVPTALHPRLCRWQLPVLRLPTHVRSGCCLHLLLMSASHSSLSLWSTRATSMLYSAAMPSRRW